MPRQSRTTAPPSWDDATDDTLYTVRDFDQTPLARLRPRARYWLLTSGALPVIVVGRRRYVRCGAIRAFLVSAEHKK